MVYGCETWALTLREERRLRVFENRIPRRIFGPKTDENGEWRIIKNFIVCTVHLIIVRVIKSRRLTWAGHVARMEEGRSAFKILTSTPTGKRTHTGLLESPCECGLEPPGSISQGIRYLVLYDGSIPHNRMQSG